MAKRQDLKKVLVIGSGPIVIGQAAEFDYAGTQALKALKEEGVEIVLVNSNPATIMTDTHMADKVYIEPLTVEFLEEIILTENPDGILATLGGQVGLNLAKDLAERGILERSKVELLGTSLEAIKKAEDRDLFKQMIEKLEEPIPKSGIVSNLKDAKILAKEIGYPLIIRPAYTLGGSGGGFVHNDLELEEIVSKGLKYSAINQVLIEKSVAGWQEIELEVMRDRKGNCIVICDMENIDPVGVHTGDSLVVAPCQTLSEEQREVLRKSAFNIINELEIQGGCNVQFALKPNSLEYIVIEVNPRVSRSSALASKATGFPIAKITAKIALGYSLDEIADGLEAGKSLKDYEAELDYVVIKIPRWPFDKFQKANRNLGSQMKATGEIMSIGKNIETALQKGIRSLELGLWGLVNEEFYDLKEEEIKARIKKPDDERLFLIGEAFRRGMSLEEIFDLSQITPYFLEKFKSLVDFELEIREKKDLDRENLKKAKDLGFSDKQLADFIECSEKDMRHFRKENAITCSYRKVNTYGGDISKPTSYYYSSYGLEDELETNARKKVLVLGSGPIRIGQGIEFDYCCVHSAWSLKEAGYESIMINNNPETVSTDFDTAQHLYFEPLVLEDVLNVIDKEKPEGVVVQFGGQTAINLAKPLEEAGVKILGTSVENIDRAEDREKFDAILEKLEIPRPRGRTVRNKDEAKKIAEELGFPVLVRPSYVLGGRAMEIVYNLEELEEYLDKAVKISNEHPILVDRYLIGKEVEVDAICDGKEVLIPGIMEHIERAGVHSGDSTGMYPPLSLKENIIEKLVKYTEKIARELDVRGLLNIQYIVHEDEVYIIEVNPRSSRTVPYLSKVTGIPMVNLATKISLGASLESLGYEPGLYANRDIVAVKMPVFSFSKLGNVETSLGPEMKSTGEVLGLDKDVHKAFYKALLASGYTIPRRGTILATISDKDKEEALPILKDLNNLGLKIIATSGTAKYLKSEGLDVEMVNKISESSPHVVDRIKNGDVDLVINTLTKGKTPARDGFGIRRAAVEFNVPCLTSLDLAKAIAEVLRSMIMVKPLNEYTGGN